MASIPDSPVLIRIASSIFEDENFAIADPARLSSAPDCLDGFIKHFVAKHDLDFHLG